MAGESRLVWKRSPEPLKRVTVEPVGLVHVVIFSEVWGTLKEPHLHRTVDVAAERRSCKAAFDKNVKHGCRTCSTCRKVLSGRAWGKGCRSAEAWRCYWRHTACEGVSWHPGCLADGSDRCTEPQSGCSLTGSTRRLCATLSNSPEISLREKKC